jgi:hypothetical protein
VPSMKIINIFLMLLCVPMPSCISSSEDHLVLKKREIMKDGIHKSYTFYNQKDGIEILHGERVTSQDERVLYVERFSHGKFQGLIGNYTSENIQE